MFLLVLDILTNTQTKSGAWIKTVYSVGWRCFKDEPGVDLLHVLYTPAATDSVQGALVFIDGRKTNGRCGLECVEESTAARRWNLKRTHPGRVVTSGCVTCMSVC